MKTRQLERIRNSIEATAQRHADGDEEVKSFFQSCLVEDFVAFYRYARPDQLMNIGQYFNTEEDFDTTLQLLNERGLVSCP